MTYVLMNKAMNQLVVYLSLFPGMSRDMCTVMKPIHHHHHHHHHILPGIEVVVVPSTSTINELSEPPCLLGLDEV